VTEPVTGICWLKLYVIYAALKLDGRWVKIHLLFHWYSIRVKFDKFEKIMQNSHAHWLLLTAPKPANIRLFQISMKNWLLQISVRHRKSDWYLFRNFLWQKRKTRKIGSERTTSIRFVQKSRGRALIVAGSRKNWRVVLAANAAMVSGVHSRGDAGICQDALLLLEDFARNVAAGVAETASGAIFTRRSKKFSS